MIDTEDGLRERIADLEDLIRWLSLAYAGNVPIFPAEDMYGNPLEHAQRLKMTYLSVVVPV